MFAKHSFKKAILHVDGDAFFASCEVAQDPSLRGKPVVVGRDRGIATAVSYEAKARGVQRGMTMWQVREVCPDVIIKFSSYDLYGMYAEKMYNIVKRYTPQVEEYSIDECFADLTGLRNHFHMSYEQIARNIKNDLESSLGMTFSVGVGPTKVIAKIASKWKKPNGFTVIKAKDIENFLKEIPIGAIWGIGPNTSAYLQKFGIKTALQFAERSETWITETIAKPYQQIWHELRGNPIYQVHTGGQHEYKSIMKTRTFIPSRDKEFIFSQISKNIERVSHKLRDHALFTKEISGYLKTQEFNYKGFELKLPHAVATPELILKHVRPHFEKVFMPGTLYRATGIIARSLCREELIQQDLFGAVQENKSITALYHSMDRLANKYKDTNLIFLGSSMRALKKDEQDGIKGNGREEMGNRFTIDKPKRAFHSPFPFLNIPFWGEAS
jgi:DNA polymerase IV